jgi:hypothetical protein
MFLALEFCLIVIFVAVALVHPQAGQRWFAAAEKQFSRFAKRRVLAIVFIGLIALATRLALIPILPIPEPEVTDEYSYLLSADTFAHGRLTNPTHPMWQHFETFQEIWQPTYSSMYYPGFGMFLAFGQEVMGHPFWGVWLSSGLMCAAICWALQGWMPAGWALLGGVMAVIRLATFSYWADSYWGGTVAALGGSLVVGALPRIKECQGYRDSLLLALGITLLLYTRPYEGFFFCLPVLGAVVVWIVRKDPPPLKTPIARLVLAVCSVLTAAFAGLGYFFFRVTGSAFTTPYQVNMRTYGLVYFPWEKPTAATGFMRTVFPEGPSAGWLVAALHHPLQLQMMKVLVVWLFFFGPLFSLPCIAWLVTRPRGKLSEAFTPHLRFLFWMCGAVWFASTITIYTGQPHYVAPLTGVFYAITLLMMRDLYHASSSIFATRFLARSVPLICLILFACRVAAPLAHRNPPSSWTRTWCSQDGQNLRRAKILSELEHSPGDHLVIVRYQPDHDFILDEWVYNHANIDDSKVIWARDMGPQNVELLHYFRHRHAWLVEPDYNPPRLTPYAE